MTMQAGVGKAAIELSQLAFPINGFSGVHDGLSVRAIWLSQQKKAALVVSIELTSLSHLYARQLKQTIADQFPISAEAIWITVTHTFSAPHITEKTLDFFQLVKQAVLKAVAEAQQQQFAALAGYGTAECSLNSNRNVQIDNGWWLGHDACGYSDHQVRIVRIQEKATRETRALLFAYDVQPAVMSNSKTSDGDRLITADFTGAACRQLEQDGVVALSLVGAAGDQAPIQQAVRYQTNTWPVTSDDLQEAGFAVVTALGQQLAAVIQQAYPRISCDPIQTLTLYHQALEVPMQRMPIPTKELQPTKEFSFQLTGQQQVITLEAIQLDSLLLLGTQPELNSHYGQQLRQASPLKNTLLATMVNGGCKYLPEPLDYQRITYTAMNTPLGQGSSDILYEETIKLFQRIAETTKSKTPDGM